MRRFLLAAIGPFLLVLAAACSSGGGEGGFPEQERADYMRSCVAGGSAESYCRCTLDAFEARYTLAELADLLQAIDRGERLDEFGAVIAGCL